MKAELLAQAQAWLADDPDPQTRAELQALLDADDETAVADRFAGFLEFGTAGLRGALGAGPNRMNRVVVGRAALGLIAYLQERHRTRVVVGYDARHNSERFALDTVELLRGAGMEALLMPRVLPTPVLAFAVEHLDADAGVMVTASHNPPQDNGYKVYLGGEVDGVVYRGSQIVPPADAQIAAHINAVTSLASAPRGTGWDIVDEATITAYCNAVTATVGASSARDISIVHTALHGVGTEIVRRVFAQAGFTQLQSVPEQANPDPDFPTVAFPNPEEPGAIDLAIALAQRDAVDLVIANDPDADRCAAAINDPDLGWRMLRGDEVGVLLGDHLAASLKNSAPPPVLAASIVSSTMLARIAEHH
ncbi:MAG TPA: phosphomannomutase, partial [Actinobacteria bacterium]|nr:phosphomannomutase [Actinomycetota bacterium]